MEHNMNIKDLSGFVRFIGDVCSFGDEQTAGDFKYTASGGEVTITGYTGSAKDVVIPDRIDNLPVTVIERHAFWNNQLTHVTIPDLVTEIGDEAFARNQLTSVTIPANVDIQVSSFDALLYANYTASGRKAAVYTFSRMRSGDFEIIVSNNTVEIAGYHGEKKTKLTIPERINNLLVMAIGSSAFEKNQLTGLTLPNSITAIGNRAFKYNQLTYLVIPDSVTVIGTLAFSYNQLTDIIRPNSDITIGEAAFMGNQLTHLTIPDSVTVIEGFAFWDNQLTDLTIPDSVVTIGGGAFADNQLTSVVIPDSVVKIGCQAFEKNQLTSVVIPDSVTVIESQAFEKNQLTELIIPDSVVEIGYEAFARNQLTSVTIPANVDIQASSFNALLYANYTANGRKAAVYTFSRMRSGDFEIVVSNGTVEIAGYHGEKRTELTIPERINNLPVMAIGSSAFEKNQLTGLTLPNSVTAIGNRAFARNQLTELIIPNSVSVIGRSAFGHNQLSSVTIPDSVVEIGYEAFYGNQLTNVVIPDSVAVIGNRAFADNQLTSVTIHANVSLGTGSFPGNFEDVYGDERKQAGTYVSLDNGKTWQRQ
jgi:hypothetical protein